MATSPLRGPEAGTSVPRAAGERRWRAAAFQAAALAALFAVQASVVTGVRADLQAERGVGPQIAVGSVSRAVSPPVALVIPSLELDTRLIGLRKDRTGRLQVPQDPQRAGWYSQGPAPGDDGPAVLVGHVDSYRGPGIFARVAGLVAGDPVSVRRADGSIARFTVEKVETFAKRDFPTDAVYRGDGTTSLRLVTCGGAFDKASKSYLSNVVVFAVPAPP